MTANATGTINFGVLGKHVSTHAKMLLECSTSNDVFYQMQSMCFHELFQDAIEKASTGDKRLKEDTWNIILENFTPCNEKWGTLQHALNKPYGYAGDFEMLEHLYDRNTHRLTHPDYACFDEYVYQLNLICAVRQRKDIIATLLRLSHQKGLRKFCSIGSGGAREVYDERDNLPGSEFLLVDLDERTFEFAESRLTDDDIKISTAQLDARRLKLESQHDVIYSFGLFDYLKDRTLDNVLTSAKNSLKPGGLIIYSIKDTNFYHPWFYDLFCDWRFVSRDTTAADGIASRNGLNVVQCIPTENGASRIYVCQIKQ